MPMGQRRLLWFSLFSSTCIYFGILWFMSRTWPEPGPFDDAIRKPLVLVLYGLALVDFVIGWFIAGPLKERDPRAGMIMRLSLFTSVAIMGLIAAFLNQDLRLYYPAWALALIGMIREWPSAEEASSIKSGSR